MTPVWRYFAWPVFWTVAGLGGSFALGWGQMGGLPGALSFLFIGAVLAVLEISLSFDNAIVNAAKLRQMRPEWQRRFLTWGIVIAVFGMRIVFPIAVVAIAAWIGPIEAVRLAATDPERYADLMHGAHLSISAFGGTFLMLVALSYFFDGEKTVHWLTAVEEPLSVWARLRGIEIIVVGAVAIAVTLLLPDRVAFDFLLAAGFGLATFLGVELLGRALDRADAVRGAAATGGFGAFMYLEVLDASFSFDGVIGAFALTQNPFLIAIGLGIGAFYVRSMTMMLVERQTLAQFRYLEHGAFWSILALAVAMFTQAFIQVPEAVTGLIGAALIGLALVSSVRARTAD